MMCKFVVSHHKIISQLCVPKGGYNLKSISESFVMCAAVLNGETPDALPAIPPLEVAVHAVQATVEVYSLVSPDLCD